jgi:hypothetical protein
VPESSGEPEPRELQELSVELRKLEVEQRRLELERVRALDSAERQHRRQEVRALRLANDAKEREGKFWRSGVFWTRAGLFVGWIAVLVPVTISLFQYWDQQAAALEEERRAAEALRKAALQETIARFIDGSSTAALELAIDPAGVSFLVGEFRGVVSEPEALQEIDNARASLLALRSSSIELTDGQRDLLRIQRDRGIDHLSEVAAKIADGQPADRDSFLSHCEINRQLRALLGEDGDRWNEHGAEIERVYRNLVGEEPDP